MHKTISLKESLILLFLVLSILGIGIIRFHLSPHIPILIVFTLLLFYGRFKGFTWEDSQKGIIKGITPGIIPIFIFLLIGILVASWILSGTIPTIMVYGFYVVNARFFLPTTFVVCTLVGMTVGSSFTTISTMGIAFLGIGHIFGFHDAMTTGAVVSGAFLGNNCSPLSDTTNLAAGIGKVNVFDHIMDLRFTDFPAFIVSLLFYTFLNGGSYTKNLLEVNQIIDDIQQQFMISPLTLLPLVVLVIGAIKKIPAIPILLTSFMTALGLSFLTQPHLSFQKVAQLLMQGYVSHTGNQTIDHLFSRGGMTSMLNAISLILLALSLGGLLMHYQVIETLVYALRKKVTSPFRLICFTACTSAGISCIVGEQYLSIVLPGETFNELFVQKKMKRTYLTRVLADTGAALNAIVPWGVSGTFITGTMKVKTLSYLPFTFFCLFVPLFTLLIGFLLNEKN